MIRLIATLVLAAALLAGCAGPELAPPGVAVAEVNLVLYQGLWHEIASTQPWFQEGCVCTQARYSLHGQEMVIKNSCRRYTPGGEEFTRTGLAQALPGSAGAQLSVRFSWPFRGGYWVIGLDPEYQWVLVGSPDRRNLWVLARQPLMDPGLYMHLMEIAKQKGYDTGKVRKTEQECGK